MLNSHITSYFDIARQDQTDSDHKRLMPLTVTIRYEHTTRYDRRV